MNVFAASHAIDDGADHDDEINEDAAHAHEALRGGVHGAGDEFSHTVLLEKSGRPFRRAAGITVYILPSSAKSQGGFPERLACSDEIRSGCAMFPQEIQGQAGGGQGSDSHAAARRPNVRASAPMTDALPKPAGHSRALRAFCRLRSARLRPLFREAASQPCRTMRPAFCQRRTRSCSPPCAAPLSCNVFSAGNGAFFPCAAPSAARKRARPSALPACRHGAP